MAETRGLARDARSVGNAFQSLRGKPELFQTARHDGRAPMTRGDRETIKRRFLDTLDKAPEPMSLSDPLPAFSLYSQTFLKRLVDELEADGLVSSRIACAGRIIARRRRLDLDVE